MQSGHAARSCDMFWPICIFFAGANFVYSSLLHTTMFTTFEVCHHHIACPSNCHAHLTHMRSDRIVPVAKIQGKARMVRHVGRYANAMGSSGMSGWEAHMLLALMMWWWLGWHHTASCGRQK